MSLNPISSDLKVTYLGFVHGSGGDALQMLTLAHGVQQLGANVEIIVPDNAENSLFVERCRDIGVPARQSDMITITGTGHRQSVRRLLTLLGSMDTDVLHIHTGDSALPRTMMLALALRRPAIVVATVHSPYPSVEPRSIRARLWAAAARRSLHAVVSPSDHGTRFQRQCGIPEHLARTTIRNSIDFEEFSSGDSGAPRALVGVDQRTSIVLFSSRLDPQKRPLDAVRIFARATPDVPSAMLVFVGAGELEADVVDEATRLGIDHRVRMVGYQTNVADWLALATVWIFPTERENFSIALLEAMAAGCAILATECPGNDEILEDESNALTFAVGDISGAARKLRRLLDDARLRDRLGQRSQATAKENTAQEMVALYVQAYAAPATTPL